MIIPEKPHLITDRPSRKAGNHPTKRIILSTTYWGLSFLFLVIGAHGVLAQPPDATQPLARFVSDSTRQATVSPQQYDFYYSAKQAEQYSQTSIASYTLDDQIKKHRFRDKDYTEVVPKGLKHLGRFDDYVMIGSGTMAEAKDNGDW